MVYENSRYLLTNQYNRLDRNSVAMLGFRQRHEFNMDEATVYQVTAGDTLDGLAYEVYGDSALRWVILDANPKYRTEFDIKVGDYIYLPDEDEVLELMNNEDEEDEEEESDD